MSTRGNTAICGVLAVVAFITLAFLAPPLTPPHKARAQSITGVNTLRSVYLTITNASALPSASQTSGK